MISVPVVLILNNNRSNTLEKYDLRNTNNTYLEVYSKNKYGGSNDRGKCTLVVMYDTRRKEKNRKCFKKVPFFGSRDRMWGHL